MTITDLFLNLAKVLSSIIGKPAAIRRANNHDLANLLSRVAEILNIIADKLESGIEPTSECYELLKYVKTMPRVIRRVVGFWGSRKARYFANKLEEANEAPLASVLNLNSKSKLLQIVVSSRNSSKETSIDFEQEIKKIREASGLFFAASNIIKAGEKI